MTNVLITGGAGFIGSNLAARLTQRGWSVTVLDTLSPQIHGPDPQQSSPLLRAVTAAGARVLVGSVTSRADLDAALDGQDVVVHYAAETGTGQSMYEVGRYVQVNVGGTATLLEALAGRTVGRVVVASSRSIYGEGRYRDSEGRAVYPPHRSEQWLSAGWFEVGTPDHPLTPCATDEDARIHPSSVYGITKQTQEQLIMTVCPTLGVEPVSLRYQNVYGPGQSLSNPYTGILSIFSNLIQTGRPINIFEDGLESRDFVYIDDVVEATVAAIEHPAAAGQVFNVGSGVPTTVQDVVTHLFRCLGRTVPATVSGNYRVGDIRHNYADLDRIGRLLGFTPSVDFATGVQRFAAWVAGEPVGTSDYETSLAELRAKGLFK